MCPEQLVSMVIANRYFYVATFFLWYLNSIICYMNMLYFRLIWTFAFGKCYSRGALRFLGCFDIDWNQGSTNNEGFLWRYCFHALSFPLLPIFFFFSHGIRVLNVKSWGGS